MFSQKTRDNIMQNYNDITKNKKKCMDYPYEKVKIASSGMHISLDRDETQEKLCGYIMDAHKKNTDPIVHEDSITAWVTQAIENNLILTVGDIRKMKPGEKMKVILFDRNVGDYNHGTKKGSKLDPTKDGFSYAEYTHNKGLTGKLNDDDDIDNDNFEWEINLAPLGYESYWGPIPENMPASQLDPNIKVGWRGPAMKLDNAKKLPLNYTHYDTWWDDYTPIRNNKLS
jgi:hypothetical protein